MDTEKPNSPLSQLVRRLAPSPTMTITQQARDLRAAGRDVISLSAGEPDFDTPAHIRAAAIAAIEEGQTRYTATDGTTALKSALVEKFQRDQKISYEPDEVIATTGGKFLIYAGLLASLNPGDEVIVPAPYWVSYPEIVRMCGGTPVIVEAGEENGFLMSPDQLRAAITPKTRWVLLNSPNNPTGAVYPASHLKAFAEVLRDQPHVWALCDDIYEHIVFEGAFSSLITVAPDLKERLLIVNGASKGYAMTGWRLGYGAGPASLIAGIRKILGQTTSNPCSIAQAAGVAALEGDHGFLDGWRAAYKRRRDKVVAALNGMEGLSCARPGGAFYVFPSCAGLIGRRYRGKPLQTDKDVASALLEAEAVATVPGSAFGLCGHLRLSYVVADDRLDQALLRIENFINSPD